MSQSDIALVIPYISPTAPRPLPSRKEIEAAPLLSDTGTRVVKLGESLIVKCGPPVSTIEGENMVFVKRSTSIRVPEVYAIYQDASDGFTFIIMELIPGETLEAAWTKLSDEQKEKVSSLLANCMKELRSIPAPAYFGSIGKRPLLESMFWTGKETTSLAGPFRTEAQMNDSMVEKYIMFGGPRSKAEFYRRTLTNVFCGHCPVFTHADFQRKNIMVEFNLDYDPVITLIDWEKSGWLPSHWEFSMAMLAYHFRDDWDKWLCEILHPFFAQYPYLRMIHLDIWS